MLNNLPNLLTLARIVLIPVIVGLLFVPADWARWVAGGLFAAAAITDYFDGYLARAWSQVSALGRFLDPIADKLLVGAVLMMLVANDELQGWSVLPALIILLREILVSGLREFLAGAAVGLPVTRLAKWKTAVQLVAMGFLVVGGAGPTGWFVSEIGLIGLWAAALLTLITGWDYLIAGLRHIGAESAAPAKPAAQSEARAEAAGRTG
ncbi:MAG TPA: CDP-diacylglycerol--glycerol-3-phosphate 3-phosphatidyltransferase [Alphaproteobacteria bacterium]|nr:CDP-diacylglycerol--glycerol-3-phosphate 3-phosphatidyltransferase [Alphaproteobacteria bacterium]